MGIGQCYRQDHPKHEIVKVPMMKIKAHFFYAEIKELDARVVVLPYIMILLPNEIDGMKKMEKNLSKFNLGDISSRLKRMQVILTMPKFKLESTIDLVDPLIALGAGLIFSPADFSNNPRNNVNEGLYVSKALQKAFIEVNEEGSEAAAVTCFIMEAQCSGSSLKPPPVVIEMNIDHPFIFLIALKLESDEDRGFLGGKKYE